MYKLMDSFRENTYEFATREERDAAYIQGNMKWDPEHDNNVNPYKGLVAKHGNCWY